MTTRTRVKARCRDHPTASIIGRLVHFTCGCVVPEAEARRKASVWDCRACIDQMFSGVRCTEHNPSYDNN